MYINDIKKLKKPPPRAHTPSRHFRKKQQLSAKASISITIDKMSENRAALCRLEGKKKQAVTLERSLYEYNDVFVNTML